MITLCHVCNAVYGYSKICMCGYFVERDRSLTMSFTQNTSVHYQVVSRESIMPIFAYMLRTLFIMIIVIAS